MGIKKILKQYLPNSVLDFLRRNMQGSHSFEFDKSLDVKKDIQDKYNFQGDLLHLFAGNKDFVINKWHHYIPLYERYFAPYRGRKIRFLEIGVSQGGSLQMWRKYLGDDAIIYGIDIDPACAQYDGLAGQVRIGSQTDQRFLDDVVKEMGGIDIVLDDGSHHMKHIPDTLTYLFPHLNEGGIYMIEDLHTAYWRAWGGGYRSKKNFFAFVLNLMHGMHHWYHKKGVSHPEISNSCAGIHVHDSVVVLEKARVFKPVFSRNG